VPEDGATVAARAIGALLPGITLLVSLLPESTKELLATELSEIALVVEFDPTGRN
jgi:hypothetical protein